MHVKDPHRRSILNNIHQGVLITKVHEKSPGAKAALRQGDIVTHINGSGIVCLGDLLIKATPQIGTDPLKVAFTRITLGQSKDLIIERHESLLYPDEFEIIKRHR